MYKQHNSDHGQITLNLNQAQTIIAQGLKTQQVRSLIYLLTDNQLSSREVVNLARSSKPELSYSQGKLIVHLSAHNKDGRYWLWDILFVPASYLAA